MGEDAVEFVGKRFGDQIALGGNRHLDGGSAGVACLDGDRAPVDSGRLDSFARGRDRLFDVRRIMSPIRRQHFFVAQNQQRLGGGLRLAFVESFGQQLCDRLGLGAEDHGQFTEMSRNGAPVFRDAGNNFFAKVGNPLSAAGNDGNHRHAERGGKLVRIDEMAVAFGHVDHVQGDERGIAKLDDLRGVIKIALEV